MNQALKILVTTVTYNPNISSLVQTLDKISHQVDAVLLFDNHSINQNEIKKNSFAPNVKIFYNNQNLGLPNNYNRAIRYGQENGFDYLLILDQDSSFDDNFLTEYRQNLSDESICLVPLLVHSNDTYNDFYPTKTKGKTELVSRSINSGTFLNLKALPTQLRFDEDLFIDCVDFNFFDKIRKLGFKVLRVNSAKLHTSLGNISRFGPFFLYNYSPFRLEKQTRDRIIFIRKHLFSPFTIWLAAFMFFCNAKTIFFEKNRVEKFKAIVRGFVKGLVAKTTRS